MGSCMEKKNSSKQSHEDTATTLQRNQSLTLTALKDNQQQELQQTTKLHSAPPSHPPQQSLRQSKIELTAPEED